MILYRRRDAKIFVLYHIVYEMYVSEVKCIKGFQKESHLFCLTYLLTKILKRI